MMEHVNAGVNSRVVFVIRRGADVWSFFVLVRSDYVGWYTGMAERLMWRLIIGYLDSVCVFVKWWLHRTEFGKLGLGLFEAIRG